MNIKTSIAISGDEDFFSNFEDDSIEQMTFNYQVFNHSNVIKKDEKCNIGNTDHLVIPSSILPRDQFRK